MHDKLIIQGAREQLKDVNLRAALGDSMIVFTGLSDPVSSSPFDTIFAEDSAATSSPQPYARQFLGQMDKPMLTEGLSPAVSRPEVDRWRNRRSTVGTITEIHDYLRSLYACRRAPPRVRGAHPGDRHPQQIVDRVRAR